MWNYCRPSLLNFNLSEPDYTFTSPEYEEYGIISKRSFVEFQVLNFGSYTAMQWDFGDSSGYQYGSNVSHQFVQSGTYDVVLTVTNAAGCSSSITKTLTVDDGYSIMIPNVFSLLMAIILMIYTDHFSMGLNL